MLVARGRLTTTQISMTPSRSDFPRNASGLAHPRAVRRHRNEGDGRAIQMKLITGLTLMFIAALAPLCAYADRTDEVQAPYWDRPDPPSQPVP